MKSKLIKALSALFFLSISLVSCDETSTSSVDVNSNTDSSIVDSSDTSSTYVEPSIVFTHKDVSMYEGDTFTIDAITQNINGTIFWNSSDTSIATVENGVITALKEGSVVISANVDEVMATCTVKVNKATQLSIDESEVVVYLRKTYQLNPKYYYKGEVDTSKTFTFESLDSSIATVDQNGYVTGKKVGKTTIVASSDDKQVEIEVEVKDLISLVLDIDEVELQPNDKKSVTITAKVKRNGVNVKDAQVNWSVMDDKVLSLTTNNDSVLATAIKCGATAIVAEYKGEIATCIVSSYKTIKNVDDMQGIRMDKDGWYKLVNDIDFEGTSWAPITPWAGDTVPLSNYFGGIFDGQGYTIKNINFQAGWHSGLFGEINENAVLKNVSIVNAIHQSTSNKTGSICALNHGRIENVYTESTVTADSQNNWNSSGGLIATNYPNAILRNCITKVKASKTYKNVGSLIGYNCGEVTNCFAIVEGNASFPFIYEYSGDLGTITNSYAVKDEQALYNEKLYYDYDKNVWEVTSYALPALKNFGKVNFNSEDTYLTINKSYKLNPSNVLGLSQSWVYEGDTDCFDVYYDEDGSLNITPIKLGSMKATVTLENGATASTTFISKNIVLVPNTKNISLDFQNPRYASTHQITLTDEDGNKVESQDVEFVSNNENVLKVDANGLISATGGGDATISLQYDNSTYNELIKVSVTPWIKISTPEDFDNMRNNLQANYCLANDIDYKGNTYKSIGRYDGNESKAYHFGGKFDGNGHTISNLNIPAEGDTSGIWGVVLETSVIKDVNFINITGNPSTTTSAGIVGFNTGLIENVYVEYTAVAGGPTDIKGAGVIAGTNEFRGTIRNCIAVVNVQTMNQGNYFGSIAGLNQGLIENSFSAIYGNAINNINILSFENGLTRNTNQYSASTKEQAINLAISVEAPYGSFDKSSWQIVSGQLPKLVVIA